LGEKKSLDILSHALVPKMQVLSEPQKQKMFETYSISGVNLPKILHTDQSVIALGAKEGDVIKINRVDATGKYEYYRIVV